MPATPKKAHKTSLLGTVSNEHSNFLSVLVTDGASAAEWKGSSGSSDSSTEDDFARANASVESGKHDITVGSGRGTVAEIGGCGVTSVYSASDDTLVMVERYAADDAGAEAEADLLRAVVTTPTAKHPKKLGTVSVSSGVLAIVSLIEKVEGVSKAVLGAVAKTHGTRKTAFGLLVPLANGGYDVWREDFEPEVKGDFGTINGRVRIVPSKTAVVTGAPIGEPAEAAKPKKSAAKKSAAPARLLAEGWGGVASFAVSRDGSYAAGGESGGYRVRSWDSAGATLWEKTLPGAANMKGYESVVVALTKDAVLAACPYGEGLFELDPKTGETRKTHPFAMRSFVLAPNERSLVMKMGVKNTQWQKVGALVCSYPGVEPIVELNEASNVDALAFSPDSALFARPWYDDNGYSISVYDALTHRSVSSVRLEGATALPGALTFSPDNVLAASFPNARVRLYEPGTWQKFVEIDAAPERAKKPSITSLAYDETGATLAIGRDDATVKVYDVASRKLAHTIDKLEPISSLRVGFSDGRLFVNAGPKGEPAGLAVFGL